MEVSGDHQLFSPHILQNILSYVQEKKAYMFQAYT